MLLMITVDDLPAEGLPYIIEKTIERGAKNIHVLNAITKKGRMEYIFFVDVEKKYMNEVSLLLALELGTLGMKTFNTEHIMLPFDIVSKNVTVKTNNIDHNSDMHIKYLRNNDNQVISLKAEYEDIKTLAISLKSKGIEIPLSKLKTIIEAEAYNKILHEENIVIKIN